MFQAENSNPYILDYATRVIESTSVQPLPAHLPPLPDVKLLAKSYKAFRENECWRRADFAVRTLQTEVLETFKPRGETRLNIRKKATTSLRNQPEVKKQVSRVFTPPPEHVQMAMPPPVKKVVEVKNLVSVQETEVLQKDQGKESILWRKVQHASAMKKGETLKQNLVEPKTHDASPLARLVRSPSDEALKVALTAGFSYKQWTSDVFLELSLVLDADPAFHLIKNNSSLINLPYYRRSSSYIAAALSTYFEKRVGKRESTFVRHSLNAAKFFPPLFLYKAQSYLNLALVNKSKEVQKNKELRERGNRR